MSSRLRQTAEAEGRQASFTLWLPERAQTILCVTYGPLYLPFVLGGSAKRVVVSSPDEEYLGFLAAAARARGIANLELHRLEPGRAFPDGAAVDAALVLGNPLLKFRELSVGNATQQFLAIVRESFSRLVSGGRLLVGWETAVGALLHRASRQSLFKVARWNRLMLEQLAVGLPGGDGAPPQVVLAFPSLWRPAFLTMREASPVVKRLAFSHAGYLRTRWWLGFLAPLRKGLVPDFLAPAMLLSIEKR